MSLAGQIGGSHSMDLSLLKLDFDHAHSFFAELGAPLSVRRVHDKNVPTDIYGFLLR